MALTEDHPRFPTASERREPNPNPHQRLMLFTFYRLQGFSPWDAYSQSGYLPTYKLDLAEENLHKLKAEELANDHRVAVLIRACQTDPRSLLRGSLGLAVVKLLDLAFHAKSERTRLRALTEIMDRGGLPAESVSLSGSVDALKKLTDKELEQEVMNLLLF